MKSNIGNTLSKSANDVEMASKTGGAPSMQSIAQTPKPQKMGWVGIIVLIFIVGAVAHFAGWDENSQTSLSETHPGVTKAEWRQKALPFIIQEVG